MASITAASAAARAIEKRTIVCRAAVGQRNLLKAMKLMFAALTRISTEKTSLMAFLFVTSP